jgi:hypothetical protein
LSVSVGSEIFVAPPSPITTAGARPGPSSQAYDLTGLAMADALGKLTEWMPEYAWTLNDGVYHLRPRGANAASQALDLQVDRFAGRHEDVAAAVGAIRDLIDRAVTRTAGAPGQQMITSMVTPAATADMKKAVTFDLAKVTVRQVLDALVTQHGRLSWTIEARRSANGATALSLRVHSFDGSTINAPTIMR